MNIVYALQPLPRSIFLAGPTPRDNSVKSWRIEAIEILNKLSFGGHVFVPEAENSDSQRDYDGQIDWEWAGLDRASVIAFWIPRTLVQMPGFTTNIEFGMNVASQKTILGYPTEAPKMNYLKALAKAYNTPVFHTLQDLLEEAVRRF